MIREALPSDAPDLERFLARSAATTMFLRGNLAKHGVGWNGHAHSTRYFLWAPEGSISAVFGITQGGYLLAAASRASKHAFQAFATRCPALGVQGMTGDRKSVEGTLTALNLMNRPFKLLRDEPLLLLDLGSLKESSVKLRAPCEADEALLSEWFLHYELDTALSPSPDRAMREVEHRVKGAVAKDTMLRLALDENGTPCAMASLNAVVGDMVQVGGVFVPRGRRSKGLGRRVTAARLQEARRGGANRAILFAANPAAERAYQSLGFRNIGSYRLALFSEPHLVGGSTK